MTGYDYLWRVYYVPHMRARERPKGKSRHNPSDPSCFNRRSMTHGNPILEVGK